MTKYKFYVLPWHGYLRVPIKELEEAYKKGLIMYADCHFNKRFVYLEEDEAAPMFRSLMGTSKYLEDNIEANKKPWKCAKDCSSCIFRILRLN